ncbi:hypothetical protein BV898_03986 [Hypsibius exemplaris]|uniref:Cadherin domain-containing protein n=1 Tax=Hypsibius exemplaris TaxID=2072580 RepID=A0A1W0X410_HYPEX|nr:hypothetical protein BV898_03986 [Hypsibius exemplaris]
MGRLWRPEAGSWLLFFLYCIGGSFAQLVMMDFADSSSNATMPPPMTAVTETCGEPFNKVATVPFTAREGHEVGRLVDFDGGPGWGPFMIISGNEKALFKIDKDGTIRVAFPFFDLDEYRLRLASLNGNLICTVQINIRIGNNNNNNNNASTTSANSSPATPNQTLDDSNSNAIPQDGTTVLIWSSELTTTTTTPAPTTIPHIPSSLATTSPFTTSSLPHSTAPISMTTGSIIHSGFNLSHPMANIMTGSNGVKQIGNDNDDILLTDSPFDLDRQAKNMSKKQGIILGPGGGTFPLGPRCADPFLTVAVPADTPTNTPITKVSATFQLGVPITYSMADVVFDRFRVEPVSGQVLTGPQALSGMRNPFVGGGILRVAPQTRSALEFRVRATVPNGMYCETVVRVNVIPSTSPSTGLTGGGSPPFFTSPFALLFPVQICQPGQVIGRAEARDADPGEQIMYLLDTPNNDVSVDLLTGVLRVGNSGNQQPRQIQVIVRAIDQSGLSSTTSATINFQCEIGPSRSLLQFSQQNYFFPIFNCNAGTIAGRVTLLGPATGPVMFQLGNNFEFTIEPNGDIRLAALLSPGPRRTFPVSANDINGQRAQSIITVDPLCNGNNGPLDPAFPPPNSFPFPQPLSQQNFIGFNPNLLNTFGGNPTGLRPNALLPNNGFPTGGNNFGQPGSGSLPNGNFFPPNGQPNSGFPSGSFPPEFNNPQNPGLNPQNPTFNPQNPGFNPQNPPGFNTLNPAFNPQNPGFSPQNTGFFPPQSNGAPFGEAAFRPPQQFPLRLLETNPSPPSMPNLNGMPFGPDRLEGTITQAFLTGEINRVPRPTRPLLMGQTNTNEGGNRGLIFSSSTNSNNNGNENGNGNGNGNGNSQPTGDSQTLTPQPEDPNHRAIEPSSPQKQLTNALPQSSPPTGGAFGFSVLSSPQMNLQPEQQRGFLNGPSQFPLSGPNNGQPMTFQPMGGAPMSFQPMGGAPLTFQPMGGAPMTFQPMGGAPNFAGPFPGGPAPFGSPPLPGSLGMMGGFPDPFGSRQLPQGPVGTQFAQFPQPVPELNGAGLGFPDLPIRLPQSAGQTPPIFVTPLCAPPNSNFIGRLRAIDPEPNDRITYFIYSTGGTDVFDVHPSTGEIRSRTALTIGTYHVDVAARDSTGRTAIMRLEISINPSCLQPRMMNDFPQFANPFPNSLPLPSPFNGGLAQMNLQQPLVQQAAFRPNRQLAAKTSICAEDVVPGTAERSQTGSVPVVNHFGLVRQLSKNGGLSIKGPTIITVDAPYEGTLPATLPAGTALGDFTVSGGSGTYRWVEGDNSRFEITGGSTGSLRTTAVLPHGTYEYATTVKDNIGNVSTLKLRIVIRNPEFTDNGLPIGNPDMPLPGVIPVRNQQDNFS